MSDSPRTGIADGQPLLEAFLRSASDGVITIDSLSRVVEFNPAAEQIFGQTRAETLGKPLGSLFIPDEHRDAHARGMARFLSSGVSKILGQRLELEGLRRNGERFPLELTVNHMELDGEHYFTGFVRDLTARREVESNLRAAKEQAEAANRAQSEFLSTMSHELRTPMTAVLGFARLLENPKVRGRPEAKSWPERIRKNAEYLLALLNDVLDRSKLEAGQMTYNYSDMPLLEMLADVEALVRPLADEKLLELSVSGEGLLPQTLRTDRVRFKQILLNLLSNAIKFTDQGSVHLAARLDDSLTPPMVRIAVRDTGSGIPPEKLDRIFEPFQQAHTNKGGTGLGLDISRRLAQGLEGELRVDSEEGQGSTFEFLVPAGEAPSSCLLDTTQLDITRFRGQRTRDPELEGRRVLIVDDFETNRELLRFVLGEVQVKVGEAEDGQAGVEAWARANDEGTPYDAILMDLNMPVLDGYQATKALRARGCATPIIALTASSTQADRDRADEAGCDAFLGKPIERDELLQTLADFFEGLPPHEPSGHTGPQRVLSSKSSDDSFRPLLEKYVGRLPGLADDLATAFAGSDGETVRQIAHRLAGTAANYGFAEISEVARACDLGLKSGDSLQALSRDVAELIQLLRVASA